MTAGRVEGPAQLSRKCGFDRPVGTFFGVYGSALSGVGGPTGIYEALVSVTTL